MKKFIKYALLLCQLTYCMLLGGCSTGSSVDGLLRPPMLSDKQEAIYSALESATGRDISLVYPRNGDYRSAFVFYDLDGDGSEEAAVFYENNRNPEGFVRINILDEQDGRWRSVYDHSGAGTSIDSVFFTDLGGMGQVKMAVGYGYITPTEKTLHIYDFGGGILSTEYSEAYYKTLSLDLDNDGGEDIAVINCNNENHDAYVSLITNTGDGAVCKSTVSLGQNTVDLPSVIGGFIGGQTPALFVDGLLGSGNISTEIIYCVNGQLRNPAEIEGSELSARTLRANGLYCCDIDGDGIIEIPEREAFPGYRENGSDSQYITKWNVFENYSVVKKYTTLTETARGYCFMLPVRWEGLVTMKSDSVTGERVFYKFNNSLSESRLELMRILAADADSEELMASMGYVKINSAEGVVYMVKFGDTEDNLLLTLSEVSNNFYLI